MSKTEGDRRMTAVQQSAAPHPAVRQRIDWIDTAKGLCMILVIVGHTLPYGNLMRNFIFSFHMPAFFFLTGYTARRPDTWQGFARRVRKDFVALIVPVLGVVQVFNVLLNFFLSDDRSLTNLWDIAHYNAITLFWASGNPADGIPSCGMPWFLFALFWGKLIWELLGLLFPKGDFAVRFIVLLFGAYIGSPSCGMPGFLFALFWCKLIWELLGLLLPKGDFAVSFIVMLFGAYIGQVQYLPQCLDVAMVVVMYLTLGQLFRQHQALLDRYRVPLFLAMLIPWTWCCQQGIYIELASRTYSNYILCASISVCGIWIFCHLCRELNANNALRPALSFLGRHSLWLFFVHHMDVFTSAIWQKDHLLFTLPCRIGWDILLSLLLLGCWTLLRTGWRRLTAK